MRVFDRHPVVRLTAKLLLILLPVLGYGVCEEARLRRMPTSYARKLDLIRRQGRETRVLILGNSEAFQGIRPSELGCPALNLANTSQSIYYDTRIVLTHLTDLPSLQVVVLPISYFSLRYSAADSMEPWRTYLYRLYFGIPSEGRLSNWWNPRNYLFLLNFTEVRRFGFHALPPGAGSVVPMDDDGWYTGGGSGAAGSVDLTPEGGAERVRGHERVMRKENVARNIADLEGLFEVLRSREIVAVLTTLPVHRSYASNMNREHYREMTSTLDGLARKYHIEYRNFLLDKRFADADFADANHLSRRGAVSFSRILRDEVLAVYLQCARDADR